MRFMNGTMEEWKDVGASWTDFLGSWKSEEVAELERRLKEIPFPKSGYWDTILTYPLDLVLGVLADEDSPEMKDKVMRCTLEYRKEIGK